MAGADTRDAGTRDPAEEGDPRCWRALWVALVAGFMTLLTRWAGAGCS